MYPSDVRSTATRDPILPLTDNANPAIKSPDVVANNNYRDDALALKYAPTLYFHPDETNFPVDPDTFLDQSILRQDGQDEVLAGPGELSGNADGSEQEWQALNRDVGSDNSKKQEGQVFLDHQDETLGEGIRAGDPQNSKLLYQYEKNTNTLTYFFFYAYNEGPQGVGDIQNHEGDWERITVQLDDQNQPTEVRYSAHDGQGAVRPWRDANEDGHPVVYVAKGSHASLPGPGDWKTNAYGILDEGAEDGRRLDLATLSPVDVTEQPWYGSNINWGERGHLADIDDIGGIDNPLQYETSGPTGPSESKGPIRFGSAGDYQDALDRKPVDQNSVEGRLSDLLRSDELAWIGKVPDVFNSAEKFLTITVPDIAGDVYRAGEEFVTETVPDLAEDAYRAGENFVTDTVPGAVEDGWNATEGFVSDRLSDGAGVIDDLVPDDFPSVGVPDLDLPDLDLPDDIPGIPGI